MEPWGIPWNNLWFCVLSSFFVFVWMSSVEFFPPCVGKGSMAHGARSGECGTCLERWYLLLSPNLADWNRFIHRRFVVAQKPAAILCICLETWILMPKLRFVRTRESPSSPRFRQFLSLPDGQVLRCPPRPLFLLKTSRGIQTHELLIGCPPPTPLVTNGNVQWHLYLFSYPCSCWLFSQIFPHAGWRQAEKSRL